MLSPSNRSLTVKQTLQTRAGQVEIFSLPLLEKQGLSGVSRLPYSLRVLLESLLRHCDGRVVTEEHITQLTGWQAEKPAEIEIPFKPARVLMQDFTGVPALVDLAAMRSAVQRSGGDPKKIEPLIPAEMIIDHSLQVDFAGDKDGLAKNLEKEFARNKERYEFMKWGCQAFSGFRIIPPGVGIIHQINLEYLSRGVCTNQKHGQTLAYPDSLVGTDSHTTMINGLGIVGWGVGGIEAEAVMLGQPIYLLLPQVIGVRVSGELRSAATATDIALTVVQLLRKKGVVNKFVEFFGPGIQAMSLPDRATIANMAPEYGATMGFFPMDQESLDYLRRSGRPDDLVDLVERYVKTQGLFRDANSIEPKFTDVVELDLSSVEPSLAGPKRPQDRVTLSEAAASFRNSLTAPLAQRGFNLTPEQISKSSQTSVGEKPVQLTHGSVVIAAITSCTNTSNASVMLAAGLLAKKAVAKGLTSAPHVKTSLTPGSRVVTAYLESTGLLPYLEKLGFQVVGYGCATCIGNSGPLPETINQAIQSADLVTAAVLSGNRNFEGRVHPLVRANYLASPPLVVAFALAGRMDIDLTTEPIGHDPSGQAVLLQDIWPSQAEIMELLQQADAPQHYRSIYNSIEALVPEWQAIQGQSGPLYHWQKDSTYIQEPPFFSELAKSSEIRPIEQARVLALFGDSVTTDHISPAGSIAKESPAGQYLISLGVQPQDFNSYGTRRGNDRVMMRGTFANIRLKNLLVAGVEGGVTLHLPDKKQMWIYDAAMQYKQEQVPLIVLAGKEYGTGSSRDWAAKGTLLLGIKAVIAESFERIHRSNLVGMGILPLQFLPGENCQTLGLTGHETFTIAVHDAITPGCKIKVKADRTEFSVIVRIDTPVEIHYYRQGGILPAVLAEALK